MNKKVKCLFVLIMAFVLQFSIAVSVSAADLDMTEIGLGIDNAKNVSARYYITCPYGDKHQMEGRGIGLAYYGSAGSKDLRISGTASQCKNCYLVLITEGNPFMVGTPPWGNYATWSPGYQVTTRVVMYTNSFGYSSGYSNDPYVQGFEFCR